MSIKSVTNTSTISAQILNASSQISKKMEDERATIRAVSQAFVAKMKELEAATDWQVVSQDPCQVWSIDREDRMVTKSQITYKLPFAKVVEYMSDPLFVRVTMGKDLEKAEVIYDTGANKAVFFKIGSVGPVSSREFIVVNTVHRQSETKVYIGNKRVDLPCKLTDPNAVRGEIHCGGFIFEVNGENETKVQVYTDSDLKGMIPGFIKNQLLKKRASNVVEIEDKIRKSLK